MKKWLFGLIFLFFLSIATVTYAKTDKGESIWDTIKTLFEYEIDDLKRENEELLAENQQLKKQIENQDKIENKWTEEKINKLLFEYLRNTSVGINYVSNISQKSNGTWDILIVEEGLGTVTSEQYFAYKDEVDQIFLEIKNTLDQNNIIYSSLYIKFELTYSYSYWYNDWTHRYVTLNEYAKGITLD